MSTATWFIGDVHGCYDALRRLEDLIRTRSERKGRVASFVSVGDLVDRGPGSAAVVRHFREGAVAGTHTAILGNHEEMMLRVLFDHAPHHFEDVVFSEGVSTGTLYRAARPGAGFLDDTDFAAMGRLLWLTQGGAQTLASWGADPGRSATWRIPKEDIAYLCSLPAIYESEEVVATHALASPADIAVLRANGRMDAVKRDALQRAMWMRRLPKTPVDTRIHVSGHTVLRRVRRYPGRRMVRVDTGACFGRRLSAWCVELDQALSVPAIATR